MKPYEKYTNNQTNTALTSLCINFLDIWLTSYYDFIKVKSPLSLHTIKFKLNLWVILHITYLCSSQLPKTLRMIQEKTNLDDVIWHCSAHQTHKWHSSRLYMHSSMQDTTQFQQVSKILITGIHRSEQAYQQCQIWALFRQHHNEWQTY